jgi:predicted phage terminase large subunit-like protein
LSEEQVIKPQPGPQEKFLSSSADIVIYGGAAGGGKSYALLMEPLRHVDNPHFGFVCFRRTSNQITNEGGLYDTSKKMYPHLGGQSRTSPFIKWLFPSGAKGSFNHLQHENDVHGWQGSQIPLIMFDELTHFSKSQFFYLLSRNRSTCGIKPYIRATTNPDSESWVADFISWWIDQDTGYPIPERGGVVRYFIRINDQIYWGNSRVELAEKYEVAEEEAKSLTFVPSSIFDNQELLKVDPGYLSNLKALPTVERERLLGGNWKIKPASGLHFKRGQVNMINAIPDDVVQWVRRWDLAASEVSESNPSPDWTAGVLIGKRKSGRIIVADLVHVRQKASDVRSLVKNTAIGDQAQFGRVRIILPQDPGQAGKDQFQSYALMLTGFLVVSERETGDKMTRAEPFSAQWQAGNVDVLVAPWNNTMFSELEGFPEINHDDIVDAAAGGFNGLRGDTFSFD